MEYPETTEPATARQQSFAITRFLSLASLAGILAAAILLMVTYGRGAVADLVKVSERGASALTLSMFNSVRREFLHYLDDETAHHLQPLPEQLKAAIRDLAKDTSVSGVRIIDDEGVVVFATQSEEIGLNLAANRDYARALEGRVVSQLSGHKGLWTLADSAEGGQLRSYVPIKGKPNGRVLGVFAVDTDITPLLADIRSTQLGVLVASTFILLFLYVFLLAMARHAERMAQRSGDALREQSQALALLSKQLINGQESEKQHIAYELHEGIVQTLCALKLRIECLCGVGRKSVPCTRFKEALLPAIQEMVQSARTLAQAIRPSTLSDFGVLKTLDWYFREFRKAHPSLDVEWVTTLNEVAIPKPLETDIFRLVEDLTKYLAQEENAHRLRIELGKTDDRILLEVADDGSIANLDAARQAERRLYLATLRERIQICGGSGDARPNNLGGMTLHADWPVPHRATATL